MRTDITKWHRYERYMKIYNDEERKNIEELVLLLENIYTYEEIGEITPDNSVSSLFIWGKMELIEFNELNKYRAIWREKQINNILED